MSTRSPVSASTSRRSPWSGGIELVGRQDVQDDQLGAGRGELADHPVRPRVEQVAEQDDDAPAVELGRGVPGRGRRGRSALGGLDGRQVGQQPEDAAEPRSEARRRAVRRQRGDRDPILAREPDVAEGSRGSLGEQELRRASRRHRRRRVDEQRDGDVLLLDEELDEQPLEAGVDVPVELAQVVAERVVAVVGELDATGRA